MVDITAFVELFRATGVALVGTGLIAGLVAVSVAAGYRWLTTHSPPTGVAAFVGLSFVSIYLLSVVIRHDGFFAGVAFDHHYSAWYLLATALLCGVVATAGGRLGDRIVCQIGDIKRIDRRDDVAELVRSARLGVDIQLPETIEDADGYRSVERSTRRAVAESTVRLPYGLSASERRRRIATHIEYAYGISYADVQLADDGSVDRVLVGNRSSGLSSMLPPATVAVAIYVEPAAAAGLGDPVEIRSAESGRLVATGTVRTITDSIATVIVDRDHAGTLSDTATYRLVTEPDDATDGYAFASRIRTLEETVLRWSVDVDGPLVGEFIGWLPGRVLVLGRDGRYLPIPDENETLEPGDELWILASPTEIDAFDPATNSAKTQA